jgi:hypothetical protein
MNSMSALLTESMSKESQLFLCNYVSITFIISSSMLSTLQFENISMKYVMIKYNKIFIYKKKVGYGKK